MAAVTSLRLTDFRSYAEAVIEPRPGFVLLSGDNGAGKTNILEAVSLLAPGRGLRGAALSEMARSDGPGNFAVAARLGEDEGSVTLGTGTLATAPDRRQLRVNSAPAAVNTLSQWLAVLWLVPAMDRLFTGSPGERRRFLDRLVLALEPAHAHHAARYEAAMRARTQLLADPDNADPAWLSALEAGMVEHGGAVASARIRTIDALREAIAAAPDDRFARADIALLGGTDADLVRLSANRGRDAAAGRCTEGPHRQDLMVAHHAKQQPAARCSTGEQKALLIGIVLAHSELVAQRRGAPPLLLLDEVAAHLDPSRRTALYRRLEGRGQVWLTATEEALFSEIGQASRYHVEQGRIDPL